MAQWTFEEGSGDTARDTTDNNNNGILHNGPVWVDDGIGKALKFDGVDDYVDCDATASLDITEQISLEAWVNPAKPSTGEPMIVGKVTSEMGTTYALTWTGTSVIFYISAGHWKCTAPIPMNRWSHVVGTYDGKRMRLYINGELTSGFIMDTPNTPIQSRGTSILLGKAGKAYFCGMLDNVRIYQYPLSEKELKAHYIAESKLIKHAAVASREKLKGLALKVHDIGDKTATLSVTSMESVESDITVPANICLKFEMGGMCDLGEGTTLTISGPVAAPLSRIFNGKGNVAFGRGCIENVYPQWWGARGDNSGDDATAIQSAIDSLPMGGVVRFPTGIYRISAPIKFHSGITFEGPATIHSAKALPAILQSVNPAARTGSLKVRRLSFNGRGVDGENSEIGIDLTSACSSTLEEVGVISCRIGIKMDGPIFCGYNNLIGISVGDCKVGIELSNSTIKTALIASNIGAVDTGVLVSTANELDIFGLSIEGFRNVGIDVLRGDTVHMQNVYFANGVVSGTNGIQTAQESGTGIRIAKGASDCTIVNPRFSRVATPIDNQSSTTLILDKTIPSEFLRTKVLFARGISATDLKANNLRGRVTISGADQRCAVKFATPEPDDQYFVTATCASVSGNPPTGAHNVFITAKSKDGFEVCLDAVPGQENSITVDWILIR